MGQITRFHWDFLKRSSLTIVIIRMVLRDTSPRTLVTSVNVMDRNGITGWASVAAWTIAPVIEPRWIRWWYANIRLMLWRRLDYGYWSDLIWWWRVQAFARCVRRMYYSQGRPCPRDHKQTRLAAKGGIRGYIYRSMRNAAFRCFWFLPTLEYR